MIAFAPEHQVTVAQVRQIVRDNGFSPKETELRIAGRIVDGADGLTLQLPGMAGAYELREDADAVGVLDRLRDVYSGRDLVIEGVVPESDADAVPSWFIQVRRFSEPEPNS